MRDALPLTFSEQTKWSKFDRLYVMIFQLTTSYATIWCTVYLSSEHGGEWDSGIEGGDGGFSE